MGCFLVDYENVQSGAPFCGIDTLTAEDDIYFFYSDNAKKIEEYYWQLLISSPCKKHFIKLKQTGKNALDFYIAVQVGNCIGQNPNTEVVIISNDKDFTAVVDYVKLMEKTKVQHVVIASSIIEALSILAVPKEQRNTVITKMNSMVTIDPCYKPIKGVQENRIEENSKNIPLEKKKIETHKQLWRFSLREILRLRKA